jgi:hypothetical protein
MGKQRATDSDVPYAATKETAQVSQEKKRNLYSQQYMYVIILVLY